VGVIALLLLVAGGCLVIYFISRRDRITHANVTDRHEVLVLAAAAPTTTYPDDPRLEAPPKPKKGQEAQEAKDEERRLMHDWAALGVLTVVSIVTSVILRSLLASGIRLVSPALWSSRSAMSCLASPACSCSLGST
jgi:hypothetical protein